MLTTQFRFPTIWVCLQAAACTFQLALNLHKRSRDQWLVMLLILGICTFSSVVIGKFSLTYVADLEIVLKQKPFCINRPVSSALSLELLNTLRLFWIFFRFITSLQICRSLQKCLRRYYFFIHQSCTPPSSFTLSSPLAVSCRLRSKTRLCPVLLSLACLLLPISRFRDSQATTVTKRIKTVTVGFYIILCIFVYFGF